MSARQGRIGQCYTCSLAAVLPLLQIGSEEYLTECQQEVAALCRSTGWVPVLVHGWPTLTGGEFIGRQFGHAWVEFEGVGIVWDHKTGDLLNRDLYYQVGKIDPALCQRYTAQQAARMAYDTGHAGPWGPIPDGAL